LQQRVVIVPVPLLSEPADERSRQFRAASSMLAI
jgi:hypothetical protein